MDESDKNTTGGCRGDYSRLNEEERSFSPGWIDDRHQLNTSNDTRSIRRAFQYRSSAELDTYWYVGDHAEYDGGGYVYDFRGPLSQLRGNLSELHRLDWIDDDSDQFVQSQHPDVHFSDLVGRVPVNRKSHCHVSIRAHGSPE
jgi:hypothetical protein